jgi:pimeloyl-ACP methyl ester carboxylesterase
MPFQRPSLSPPQLLADPPLLRPRPDKPVSIVLVHGGFVDGSGWQAVHKILKNDGYDVIVVQNPTVSLADDVAVTKRAIAAAKYPVVLVGHSYGGVVISEAGNDPKVRSLAYIAAFAPDAGESVETLIANPGARLPSRRSFRRKTASSSSTARSSRLHSPPMSIPPPRSSWRTRRFRGASMLWRARSAFRPGSRSRAIIWLRATTG